MKKSWFGRGLWPGPCVFTLSVRSLAVAGSLTLGACSGLTNPSIPHVGIGTDGSGPFPTNPTFSDAKKMAQFTIKELNKRADDLDQFDLATGSLLVGAGIAGLALGIYDAHSDAVYGAALGAGTAYAGRSFLPFRDRKAVYRKGSTAIACVMSTVSLGVQEMTSEEVTGIKSLAEGRDITVGDPAGALVTSITSLQLIAGRRSSQAADRPVSSDELNSLQSRSGMLLAPSGENDAPAFAVMRALAGAKTARLANSVKEHRRDADDLANSLTAAIASRGMRIHEAVRTIVEAVNTKVDNLPITPGDALTAALDQVGSTNKLLTEKARNLKEGGDDSIKDAKDAKENLSLAASLAPGGQNSLRTADLTATIDDIEMLKKESENVTTISDGVLKLLGDPGTCVASLK